MGIALSVVTGSACFAKDGKEKENPNAVTGAAKSASTEVFAWNDHSRLSWQDFQGAINAAKDESAAATHCSIGFLVSTDKATGKPGVIVYNTFYAAKSWVRPDARIPEVLAHEQGHFDLCELYTRKLRALMTDVDMGATDVQSELQRIYSDLKTEYETAQQAYEEQTTHGTNAVAQQRWSGIIAIGLKNTMEEVADAE